MKTHHLLSITLAVAFVAAALLVPEASYAFITDPNTVAGLMLGNTVAALPMANLKQLREERAKLVADAQKILTDNVGDIPKEAEARFDALMAEADKKLARIQREERAYDAARETDEVIERRSGREMPGAGADADPEAAKKAYRTAFGKFIRGGNEHLTPEERSILRGGARQLDSEERALSVTTTGGGYLIPQGFSDQLEKSMLDYSGVLSAPTKKLRTDTGNSLPWPTVDDTSNTGALLGINTAEANQDVTYGQILFAAYKFTSKQVLVPVELMQDSAFDIDTHLSDLLAERVGRILEQYLTTGTGSGQPQGIVVGAGSGTTLSGTAYITNVQYTDLVDLQHSVDRAYRKGAGFMFHDQTLKILKKLVDSQNRPLWLPGVAMREPDTILGDPYFINQQMAQMGGGNKSMIYGNLSKYVVRMVKDMTLVRFNERYMDSYQIGFQLFMRADGRLLDSGTDPIKYLQHPTG